MSGSRLFPALRCFRALPYQPSAVSIADFLHALRRCSQHHPKKNADCNPDDLSQGIRLVDISFDRAVHSMLINRLPVMNM